MHMHMHALHMCMHALHMHMHALHMHMHALHMYIHAYACACIECAYACIECAYACVAYACVAYACFAYACIAYALHMHMHALQCECVHTFVELLEEPYLVIYFHLETFNMEIRSGTGRTFGCPLKQNIKLTTVTYGRKLGNCWMDNMAAKVLAQSYCTGSTCRNVKVNREHNPCHGKPYSAIFNISYQCELGKLLRIYL